MSRPFLKWAGGKSWAVPYLLELLPKKIGVYREPMLGGGALFHALATAGRFERAVLSDVNWELIGTYRALQDALELERVISFLRMHVYEKSAYLEARAQDPAQLSPAVMAARMIYLNKTGFNGLYRVNAAGKFNVPFGKYENPTICDEENLRAAHASLQRVELVTLDYEHATQNARQGDVVYFDPPYVPASSTSNFTGYVAGGWTHDDHARLAKHFATLAKGGVTVLLSNSDTEATRALYEGFEIRSLQARRNINSKGAKRGSVGEILVYANCGA